MNYILTQNGVHAVMNGKMVTVAKSDKIFEEFCTALKNGATEAELEEIRTAELRRVEQAVEVAPDLTLKGGQIYYQGMAVASTLSSRIVAMVEEGFPLTNMVKFIENLYRNPSNQVVERLYEFLEQGKNPITENGTFLAYKAVRDDYKDIHSGTFDNSIGAEPTVPRHRVDEDSDRTCSYGLHVCSFDYLPFFSHADGHVMVCEVDPADVVAIPRDYNNTKMRVCRYKVIAEHEGYYQNKGDVLSDSTVRNTDNLDEEPFVVETRDDSSSRWTEGQAFSKLSQAAALAEELSEAASVQAARVVNRTNGAEVFFKENPDFIGESDPNAGSDEWEGYTLQGRANQGMWFDVESGFDDLEAAILNALERGDEYSAYRVIDASNGEIVRTLS